MSRNKLEFLSTLDEVIEQRKTAPPDASYTARLFAAGPTRIAQKVGEEAIEVALAGAQGDREQLVAESADLLYHLLVLLRSQDLDLQSVAEELAARHG